MLEKISGFIWGLPMIFLLFGTHIYLSFKTGFIQRKTFYAIKLSLKNENSSSNSMSPFPGALSVACFNNRHGKHSGRRHGSVFRRTRGSVLVLAHRRFGNCNKVWRNADLRKIQNKNEKRFSRRKHVCFGKRFKKEKACRDVFFMYSSSIARNRLHDTD